MIKFYKHSESRAKSLRSVTSHKDVSSLAEFVNYWLFSGKHDNLELILKPLEGDEDYTHMVCTLESGKLTGVAGFIKSEDLA